MRRETELAERAEELVRRSDVLRGELRASLAEVAREGRPLFDALRMLRRYAGLAGFLLRLAGPSGKGGSGEERSARLELERDGPSDESSIGQGRKRRGFAGFFSFRRGSGATASREAPLLPPLVSVVVSGAGIVIGGQGPTRPEE